MVRFGHDNFEGAFRIRSETIKNHCLRNSFRNDHFPLGVSTFRNGSFFIVIQVFAQTIKNPLGCYQNDGFLALLYKAQINNPREIVQKHWFFFAFCAVLFLLHFRGCECRVRVQKSPRSARLPSKFRMLRLPGVSFAHINSKINCGFM